MNILLNDPQIYHDWTKYNTEYEERIKINKNIDDFFKKYYSEKNKFTEKNIVVYEDIIPDNILNKILNFIKNALWNYNYEIIDDTYKKYINIEYEEIKKFSVDLYHNIYFSSLLYNILLPNLNIENKDNLLIDRVYLSGRLHGLSDYFHKDSRSSEKYGPSIYIFLNKIWKPYYDGSSVFILDDNDETNTIHIENKLGRIIVFPPNIQHKICEISGYGLLENAFSNILEYHLIYK